MNLVPFQLGDAILPAGTAWSDDHEEDKIDTELVNTYGSRKQNRKPYLRATTATLVGNYDESLQAMCLNGSILDRKEFTQYLQFIQQTNQFVLGIGEDNRIYRFNCRVELINYNQPKYSNGFTWQVVLEGYDVFYEDVTDFCYYYHGYDLVSTEEPVKYTNELQYEGNHLPDRPIRVVSILELAGNTDLHFKQDRKLFWDTTATGNTQSGLITFSSSDKVEGSGSIVFDCVNTQRQTTVTFNTPKDMSAHADGAKVTYQDYFEFYFKNDNGISNFDQLNSNIKLFSTGGGTLTMNFVNACISAVNGEWSKFRIKFSDMTLTGNFNFASITQWQINWKRKTVGNTTFFFNNFWVVKGLGYAMQPVPAEGLNIPNYTAKTELYLVAMFQPNSTKRYISINGNSFNFAGDSTLVVIQENRILVGSSTGGLVPVTTDSNIPIKFDTLLVDNQIGIRITSDQSYQAYYTLNSKYL